MKIARRGNPKVGVLLGILIFVGGVLSGQAAWALNATVTMEILNPASPSGDHVLSKGTQVEVEFIVVDPNNELDKNDKIQLVREDDDDKVSDKKRGNNLTGTVSLNTNKSKAIGELRVEYVHDGQVLATIPASPNQVVVLADDGSVVLSQQIEDLAQQIIDVQTSIDDLQAIQIGALQLNPRIRSSFSKRPRQY